MNDAQNDELDLFFSEMSDVKPIQQDAVLNQQAHQATLAQQARKAAAESEIAEDANQLSTEYVEPIDPYDLIEYKKDGVQEGVFRKLRLGKYQVEATLNLNHSTVQNAKREIFHFINDCYQKNIRTLLIVHGIGKDSKPYPAVIKSHIAKWLPEFEQVLACHTAIKAHGGYGATYTLLKKSEEKRIENRERHLNRRAQ